MFIYRFSSQQFRRSDDNGMRIVDCRRWAWVESRGVQDGSCVTNERAWFEWNEKLHWREVHFGWIVENDPG
jgi:hypothetical protein